MVDELVYLRGGKGSEMRRWKRGLALGLALGLAFAIGAFAASEIWTERAAKLILAGLSWSAGLESKSVTTSFGDVAYLEGGEGQTIVFLHGIFALKEHWIEMSRQVSGDYRVILLDLPGFGENQRLPISEYDYGRQTENVLETLDRIGVSDFHIAANSMGAQIAAQLAIAIPYRVQSLSFVGGPAGVSSPVPSDMETAIAAGRLPLVVATRSDYDARMAWLFPKEPFIPRPVAHYWTENEVALARTNREIWDVVAAFAGPGLEELAHRIEQPSLIIWCEEDRIFHVSGASVLAKALNYATLHRMSECGHLPMLDRPEDTGRLLLEFLSRLRKSQ